MSIQENNKLIAEFMGEPIEIDYEGTPLYDGWKDLEYHESWDWLMPVVKYCTDLTRNFEYDSEHYLYWQNELFHPDYMLAEFIENDISSIYSRVVEFIKWHEERKTKRSF